MAKWDMIETNQTVTLSKKGGSDLFLFHMRSKIIAGGGSQVVGYLQNVRKGRVIYCGYDLPFHLHS
jgi:hypothetical protein